LKNAGKIVPLLMNMLVRKPNTMKYPYEKAKVQKNFRGKLRYDAEKCIGCRICERVCPADAIEIKKVAEKSYKAYVYLDRCVYCGQCVESCTKKALENTEEFELASLSKDKLRVEI
jgi:formate hydrogenlyase subunit 6/NADH:ubiquinone oxidoreductase subunit I